jgi:tryptophan 7-halogenase
LKNALRSEFAVVSERVRKIVVAGGGAAGWMMASLLGRHFERQPVIITVVESSQIGTVGVGEATVPAIHEYFREIGIDAYEVMRATQGTVKLGIEFDGWARPGRLFFHPFGLYGTPDRGVPFHQYWLRLRQSGDPTPLDAYSLCTAMARANRFRPPPQRVETDMEFYRWAVHFDASLFAHHLREFALRVLKVGRIDAKIVEVRLRKADGFIESLQLDTGQTLAGDLFIDCTGFRAVLLGEALGVAYCDWGDVLPCDRAVAMPCTRTQALTPYTRSIARAAGWQWRIPLQHRVGNGYVYSSLHISDDEAVHTLRRSVEGEPLGEPFLLRFTTGRREKFWEKNCIAAGLAAGFMEPLESTSITLIQTAAERLVSLFPDLGCSGVLVDEFNRQTTLEYERIRDFLVLHYLANCRQGEPFWDQCRQRRPTDHLARKIRLFQDSGRLVNYEWETFFHPSWLSMYAGFDMQPDRYDRRADSYTVDELRAGFARMRVDIRKSVSTAMPHAEFIAQHCAAAN